MLNIKKIGLGILVTVVILSLSGVVVAKPDGVSGRYFIGSNSGILKAMTGVTHNFDYGYTTELTPGRLKALERLTSRLGIEIQEVQLYHILGKPTCNNNGICEPGLGENASCADCKNGGEEPAPPPGRTCYPTAQTPWGVVKVNGGTGGLGVDVAVLDTGVYGAHLDLSNRVEQCKDFTKGPKVKTTCNDGNGHGTHVAGTILADAGSDGKGIYGVAPEADLFAYKVCSDSGSCWADDIATAIRHASDQGAEIVSMSLGGDTQSSLIKDAIDYAVAAGVLVVAAAGNDGPDEGSIDYPGANIEVIAVGAIDSDTAVPDWSSRGVNPGAQAYVIEEKEVEFGAPGVSVESTWNDGCYYVASGTSMATPHVSGLAAKLWHGTASDTRGYLQSIAVDIWDSGDDTATGFGLPVAP